MRCPFLEEASVRSCGVAQVRKMIPSAAIQEDHQRCSSPEYTSCPIFVGRRGGRSDLPFCPFLTESRVQYCTAAPARKFIPYSEDLRTRCNGAGYRYCESYLRRESPTRPRAGTPLVGEIPLPAGLAYTRNHMWFDVAEDGPCYVGVDGFLARLLGDVGEVTFVSPLGPGKPSAVITAGAADLSLTFPHRVDCVATNRLLRVHPERMATDPYGSGWLFEGRELDDRAPAGGDGSPPGFLRGTAAVDWMRAELTEMSDFVQELLARREHRGQELMGDGGVFAAGLARYLDREELLRVFSRFFSAP